MELSRIMNRCCSAVVAGVAWFVSIKPQFAAHTCHVLNRFVSPHTYTHTHTYKHKYTRKHTRGQREKERGRQRKKDSAIISQKGSIFPRLDLEVQSHTGPTKLDHVK